MYDVSGDGSDVGEGSDNAKTYRDFASVGNEERLQFVHVSSMQSTLHDTCMLLSLTCEYVV
jgi:hypothetical protein